MDQMIRLRPTTYTALAGDSGAGKTAMAIQLAEEISKQLIERGDDRKVLIFSAEMSGAELAQRIAAARTGISVWEQEGGRLTDTQMATLEVAFDAIAEDCPFQIDENESPDAKHIFQSCEIIQESHGLGAVIFDYVELANTGESGHGHVEKIAKMLKTVAKRFDIPTIGLSQLNRNSQHRSNKAPVMDDLRYGGFQPADAVIILQEDVEVPAPPEKTCIVAHVVKNRGGKKGRADMLFHGATTSFEHAVIERTELDY